MKQKQGRGGRGQMAIGVDMDGRGGEMQPKRDLSEETALAGGEMGSRRRREEDDEEMGGTHLLSPDWGLWMVLPVKLMRI